MSIQNLLGDAGACPEISWNGKVWRIGHPTQRAKAVLEELVAAKAIGEVTALKTALPPETYAEVFQGVLDRVSGGEFRTFGRGWVNLTTGGTGAVLFLLSLLRERHPDATESDAIGLAADRGDEVQGALGRVIPSFFELLLETSAIPAQQKQAVRAALGQALSAAPPPPPTPTDSVPTASN